MSVCLSNICLAEADHPNACLRLGETQHMQPLVQIAQRNETGFAIFLSGIGEYQRSIEIDFGYSLELELALLDISLVLDRVEVDIHDLKCMHKM
jgi:hypothetical protein